MDSRGCKSLDEFSPEAQEDGEDEEDLVIVEEDSSEVEGDILL